MRAWLIMTCCVPMILGGCRSVSTGLATSAGADVANPFVVEQDLARALAHFGQARLFEATEGPGSGQALDHYRKAAEADPANHDLASRIAVAALHRRDPDSAIAAMQASYLMDPSDNKRTVDLAAVHQAAGRTGEAIGFFRKALDLNDSATAVYIALASLLFQSDRDAEAVATLGTGHGKAEEPYLLGVYTYDQARRFVAQGQFGRSIPCFELLLGWDEIRKPQLYLILGELYAAEQRPDDAILIYRKATERDDAPPEAFIALSALLLSDHAAEAVKALVDARERFPHHPDILFSLGSLYSDAGDIGSALPLFEAARSEAEALADKGDGKAAVLTEVFYLYLGDAYAQTGREDEAAAVFEFCIARFPESHRALNYLAYMWAEAGIHLDQALKYSIRSLTFEPRNPAYLDTLGWIYFRMGMHDMALESISMADSIMEDDPEILLHLGDVHEALGHREQAITYWIRSWQGNPDPGNRAGDQLRLHGAAPEGVTETD